MLCARLREAYQKHTPLNLKFPLELSVPFKAAVKQNIKLNDLAKSDHHDHSLKIEFIQSGRLWKFAI